MFEKSYERNNIFLSTFKSCPNIFQQLYCIHASIKRGSEEIYVLLYTIAVYYPRVGKIQSIHSENMFNLINQYFNENSILMLNVVNIISCSMPIHIKFMSVYW